MEQTDRETLDLTQPLIESWSLPLGGKRAVVLSTPRPLTENEYDMIEAWLKLMRPVMVQEASSQNDESGELPEPEVPDGTD